IATNIIQAHPDIRGFYCANDDMALAVAEAVAAAGKQGQIIIVGTDFIEDAKQAIKEGRMQASVAFSPYMYGQLGVRMAVMVAEGKPIPEGVHTLNVLVTKDNVAQMEDWK
ncbi:MAG: substrate-binding domain-containing protein, partial [Chloroflexi bacterium]|nr:substrate-binding domain-containing protein [Chloroflexota bacterium]